MRASTAAPPRRHARTSGHARAAVGLASSALRTVASCASAHARAATPPRSRAAARASARPAHGASDSGSSACLATCPRKGRGASACARSWCKHTRPWPPMARVAAPTTCSTAAIRTLAPPYKTGRRSLVSRPSPCLPPATRTRPPPMRSQRQRRVLCTAAARATCLPAQAPRPTQRSSAVLAPCRSALAPCRMRTCTMAALPERCSSRCR